MAVRYNKINLHNEIYFITFTILGWRHVFITDKYRNLIYKWFAYMKEKYDNIIYGYVIIPNHIHLIIKITEKSTLPPVLIQNAKRFLAYQIVELLGEDNNTELLNYFASRARSKYGARHKVFEDKYDSLVIQSEKLFLEKLNYIHNNPCQEKWKLADTPEDYKYSSAANYILGIGYYNIDLMNFN
jgi:putative transposase